jgi:hypothetical protein
MWLNSAIDWLIQGNTFQDAKYSALQINTSDVDQTYDIQILDNTFTGTTQYPDREAHPEWAPYFVTIGLGSPSYNVEIRGNRLQDNLYHAIYIQDRGTTALTGVVIECNEVVNTVHGSVNELPGTVLPAENNYWGAADGPSGVGPGSGDAVTDGFDYSPWLTAAPGPVCPTPLPASSAWTLLILGIGLVVLLGCGLARRAM